jgi:LPS sulfotransferase NodH
MPGAFDFFVILGDMRTGSNLLEESVDAYEGLRCHGELFNPLFAGHEGQESLFGMSLEERDRDPLAMIARMKEATEGTGGFRLFPGHDPRVLEHCLAEPRCAKVILARNPVDSYVSLKIARKTGQWWLGDLATARTATVRFDPQEFDGYLQRLQGFYGHVRRALQTSGQTAFHIHYEDLGDASALDGLASWLGAVGPAAHTRKGRVQNPVSLDAKVENFAEMEASLGRADAFDLYRIPDLEPRRGPNVPGWLASEALNLLYMPLAGGPTDRIAAWLEAAGGAAPVSGWTRKSLRRWLHDTPGHRSFTVVTHPLQRAHDVFCEKIVPTGPGTFLEIRNVLRNRYGVDLPEEGQEIGNDLRRLRSAFLGFLRFLKGNLAGQTSVRVPAAWSSQTVLVRALAEVAAPDMILRAETVHEDIARLKPGLCLPLPMSDDSPTGLGAIHDAELEEAARAAYPRDYLAFGYGDWR